MKLANIIDEYKKFKKNNPPGITVSSRAKITCKTTFTLTKMTYLKKESVGMMAMALCEIFLYN